MAISDRLNKLTTDITNAYSAVQTKGGTIPTDKNTNNLSTAIDSIEVIEQATAEGESLSLANTKAMPYKDYKVEGKSEQATRILPEDYTQVEYIESTGTQWIDTNCQYKVGDELEIKVAPLELSVDKAVFGIYEGSGKIIELAYLGNRFRYNVSQTNLNYSVGSSYLFKNIDGYWYYNNEKQSTTQTTTDTTGNMILFGRMYRNADKLSKSRVYYFSLKRNNTLIRNMIPCYRNSDNVVGMYDTINDVFYTNQGTGTFLKGNDVSIPNPDYPSEIHSVADDVNLYNIETANVTALGSNIIVTKERDKIKMVCSGNVYGAYLGEVQTDKIEDYTIKLKADGGVETLSQWGLRIRYQDGTYSAVSMSTQLTFRPKQENETITLIFYVRVGESFTGTVTLSNIKLQKGTEATPYSPYNQGTVTIKQRGKNLFNKSKISSFITAYTITIQDGGFVINTGGLSNGGSLGLLKDLCPELKVGDKFKFSWTSNATRNNNNVTYIYLSQYASTIIKETLYICTQTMLDSDVYFYGQQGEYYKNIIFYLDGQTADYEPYNAHDYTFQTEPLRSLPNGVKDTIEAEQHRKIEYLVFDGSDDEGWGSYTLLSNNIVQVGKPLSKTAKSRVGLSNRFSVIADYSSTEHIVIAGGLTAVYIHIDQTRFNTQDLAGFKEWLSNNPVTLQYELAEETIEPLTQNQATTMLDIIKTGSYEGTTNIYTDEDVKPTIGVEYYKKG